MSFLDDRKVQIDGEVVTFDELVRRARDLDPEYGADGLYMTSQAAKILRTHGATVEEVRGE